MQAVLERNCELVLASAEGAISYRGSGAGNELLAPCQVQLKTKPNATLGKTDPSIQAPPRDWVAALPPKNIDDVVLLYKLLVEAIALFIHNFFTSIDMLVNRLTGREVRAAAPRTPPPPLAWHPHQPRLAGCDAADRILIFNHTPLFAEAGAPVVLEHWDQHEVKELAWRPMAPATLAAAVANGVHLLSALPPNQLALPNNGGPSSGLGLVASRWRRAVLKHPGHVPVHSLSWSPCGRYLASASALAATPMLVWDVPFLAATPLKAALGGVRLVRWSPCGNYLFAALTTPAFLLFETHTWTHERWETGSGCVQDACWGPTATSSLLLFVLEGSTQLITVQFASPPPKLTAHLLPLACHELRAPPAAPPPSPRPPSPAPPCITALAWDPAGTRLAVILGGSHPHAGQVAVYATHSQPMLTANFIQYIEGPVPSKVGGAEMAGEDANAAAAIAFQGSQDKPGTMLAVHWGDKRVSICKLMGGMGRR